MVNEEHRMIRFVPNVGRTDLQIRHIIYLPFMNSGLCGTGSRQVFLAAAADTAEIFSKGYKSETGLAPDYANFDGTPYSTQFNQRSGNFSFDARRTQMNWAVTVVVAQRSGGTRTE